MKYSYRYSFILLLLTAALLFTVSSAQAVSITIGDAFGLPDDDTNVGAPGDPGHHKIQIFLEGVPVIDENIKAIKFQLEDVTVADNANVIASGALQAPGTAVGGVVTYPLIDDVANNPDTSATYTIAKYDSMVLYYYQDVNAADNYMVAPMVDVAMATSDFLPPDFGLIAEISIYIPQVAKIGQQVNITLSNILALRSDNKSVNLVNATGQVVTSATGSFWIGSKGNVDYTTVGSENQVDLFDVLAIVDIILKDGGRPSDPYTLWAADIVPQVSNPSDPPITINDVTAAMDMAVAGPGAALYNPSNSVVESAGTVDFSLAQPTINETEIVEIPVQISSSVDVRGVQMVLDIDQDVYEVQAVEKMPIAQNMTLVQRYTNNKLSLLLVDKNGKSIPTGAFDLVKIPLKIKDGNADAPIAIEYAVAADKNGAGLTASYEQSTIKGVPVPKTFALYQNSPNPFNMSTTIYYDVPGEGKSEHVELSVFNIKGQLVKTLVSGQKQAGSHTIQWDGTDMTSQFVSTGIYFYRLKSKGVVLTKKLAVTK